MGHSWGGFSTMNIAAIHPDITHVVSMSGFVSVERILKQTFSGLMSGYAAPMLELERQENPRFARYNALESLSKTSAKVLLIYSDDDTMVKKEFHYDPLFQKFSASGNIRFLLLSGKDHNPNYTADAVKYKNEFFAAYSKAVKKKQLETPEQQTEFMAHYDWERMTEQDEDVWNAILTHLKSE